MRLVALLALGSSLIACSAPSSAPEPTGASEARALLRPSVRRLSVAELSASASALIGAEVEWSSLLPPDARQDDFSRSLTQSVDASTLKQLDGAAQELTQNLELAQLPLPPCALQATRADEACRVVVVRALSGLALRRAPTEPELSGLGAVFDAGAAEGGLREGVTLLLRALLSSSGHLYDTALGAGDGDVKAARLTDEELGSQLAWLVSGRPPDPELARAARAGELRDGERRREQARRLMTGPASRSLFRSFVEEWLGLNRLRGLAKSTAVVADFRALQEPLLEETGALVDDLMATSDGSLAALFAGGFTFLPNEVAALYGVRPGSEGQRVSLGRLGRVGILQQASFLATFAHEDGSAPVLRGKAVLERLLCRKLPKPAELGIDLVLPSSDPTATTRERFATHAEGSCAGCHAVLDGIGFTFENFDAVGRLRAVEVGKPVDTSGQVTIDGPLISLRDSAELAQALASSEDLATCAARHVVRFAAGSEVSSVEEEFVTSTRDLPLTERGSLGGLLLAFVAGDWFAWRAP